MTSEKEARVKIKEIKVGRWYETTHGTGECTKSGGTFPPSVVFRITSPMPLGARTLAPREVIREVQAPKGASEKKP